MGNQFKAATDGHQVGCNQRHIGGDEDKRGGKSYPATVVLAQYFGKPFLRETTNFGTGELDGLIHWRREQHQPEMPVACHCAIHRISSDCRRIVACHTGQEAWTQYVEKEVGFFGDRRALLIFPCYLGSLFLLLNLRFVTFGLRCTPTS